MFEVIVAVAVLVLLFVITGLVVAAFFVGRWYEARRRVRVHEVFALPSGSVFHEDTNCRYMRSARVEPRRLRACSVCSG